jgi:transcriptional regulator with XRE-family HTH domain
MYGAGFKFKREGTYMDFDKSFGSRLSYAMDRCNMRQKDLAKASNVTEATVSRYVNNKRYPDIEFVRDIVQILNINPGFLLGVSDKVEIEHHPAEKSKYRIVREHDNAAIQITKREQVVMLDRLF